MNVQQMGTGGTFVFAVLSLFLALASAQVRNELRPPQLRLEIVPLKKTYTVGETVFVRYKLTSLSDGTLCFPSPNIESANAVSGHIKTEATPPDGVELFIEHFYPIYPRYPTDDELRSNVTNRWIKLGMSEPYKPRASGKVTVLSTPGEWVLKSTYYPPELNPHTTAIFESLGCTPPNIEVHAMPVTITVAPSSN